MTPEEKAQELVSKYRMYTEFSSVHAAKQCALIAVDEIIKSNPTSQLSDSFLGNRTYENVNYWQEVKQEIQNI
jgi:hypothetical protein